MDKYFVYINAKKQVNAYTLYNVSESEEHFQGVCNKSNQLKTFRKDRVIKECSSYDLALVDLSEYKGLEHPSFSKTPKVNLFEICFTGFKKDDKERLISLATDNKMSVRASVTQNLQVLCCGYNAGPKKVDVARMKGVVILDENQFQLLVETGEMPDF
ncbi:BRCT domain-containing protein [Rahnella sp. FC061912-K]|uniref:BRCT domain-containing protein n=1 Tax=Rahnella rivi TaxID=2816249 RepID=UPI001C277C6A|nr:BRCT domain-containing protein [Rahnella rivi]MBU9832459.1 BRCT domain-containing protein [Rahnella rivi]